MLATTALKKPQSLMPALLARIFIVDDDPDVRRAISLLVRSVGLTSETYASPQEFLEKLDPKASGCLLLDVRMPGMTGLQLQQELKRRGIRLPVIFISAHGEIPLATAAMRAGAVDFLPKPFSPQALLERINEAIEIDTKQRELSEHQEIVERRIAKLTNREQEIMQLLAQGESTKVIARRLEISPKTVDNHRAKILEKMQVDSIPELILLKVRSEL